jgi:16S rRNA U516 pseudouridylate synthase RsuA-like enzyme
MLQCAAALEDAATGLVVLSEDPSMIRKLLDERTPLEHEMLAEVQGPCQPRSALRHVPHRTQNKHQQQPVLKKRVCAWLLRGTSPGMRPVSLETLGYA